MNEKYFAEQYAELQTIMKMVEDLYGIKPLTTNALHWFDDPNEFFRLSDKANTIASAFLRMSDILNEMGHDAIDGLELD
jgi:hypothetical protein